MKSILKKHEWIERMKRKGKREEEETCVLKSDEPECISNHKLTTIRSNSKINDKITVKTYIMSWL